MTRTDQIKVRAAARVHAEVAEDAARKALDLYKSKTCAGKDLEALKMLESVVQTLEVARITVLR